MRRAVFFIHKWLGLTAGLVFAIASLTGAFLVYQEELDTLIGGPRFHTTPGLIEPVEIESALRRHRPAARLVRVIWPADGANVINVRIIDGGRQQDLVFDAGSGALLRPRPVHLLLQATRRLHAGLLIGPIGARVVLYASAASIISLVLGVVLWWPGVRRLAHGFRIRWRRGVYVLNFDLHQTLGVLALPLLLVMTVTGVLFNPGMMNLTSRLLHGGISVDTWTSLKSATSDPAAPGINLQEATQRARAGHERTALTRIEFPSTTDGVIVVWMRDPPQAPVAGGTMRVALDRVTGDVLARQHLQYDSDVNARLHYGWMGGTAVRVLYVIACFVGFGLLPTGVALWWIKRKREANRNSKMSASL
jgi:uncharacterized iron-regulated membrane protein